MVELICEHCKKLFLGRPNRRTCSVACRRTLEAKRLFWDRKFSYVKFCEMNATWEVHTSQERAHWQKKADEAREKLLKIYGNRP